MNSTPFTADNCGSALDLQIAIDYFANLRNQTYTYDCLGTIQAGPSIAPCYSSLSLLTFCIGGYNQQHACIAGKCVVIDWTYQHAPPCPSTIMQFVNVQPVGLATPCCDNRSCTTVSSSDTFDCARNADLWLCVVDGRAAECVKPSDDSICSGNLTNPVAVASTTSADPFSIPTADGGISTYTPQASSSSSSSTRASGGLSTNDMVIVIVVPVVVFLAALVGVLRFKKVLPAYLKRRRDTPSGDPPGPNSVTVSGGALTDVRGNSYTYVLH